MSLGTKLRELRTGRNLSQTQVAMELDVSQTAYGKWESDQSKPGLDNLLKISEFYETDIYDLLENKDGNHNFNNTYDNSNVNNAVENYQLLYIRKAGRAIRRTHQRATGKKPGAEKTSLLSGKARLKAANNFLLSRKAVAPLQ